MQSSNKSFAKKSRISSEVPKAAGPNVLTRKSRMMAESSQNSLHTSTAGDATIIKRPNDETFIVESSNYQQIEKRVTLRRELNSGTPLSSKANEPASTAMRGAKPKKLSDITNTKKVNDSLDDDGFKVPQRPALYMKSMRRGKEISFDDLKTDDDTDDDTRSYLRSTEYPEWSRKENRAIQVKVQSLVNPKS